MILRMVIQELQKNVIVYPYCAALQTETLHPRHQAQVVHLLRSVFFLANTPTMQHLRRQQRRNGRNCL